MNKQHAAQTHIRKQSKNDYGKTSNTNTRNTEIKKQHKEKTDITRNIHTYNGRELSALVAKLL